MQWPQQLWFIKPSFYYLWRFAFSFLSNTNRQMLAIKNWVRVTNHYLPYKVKDKANSVYLLNTTLHCVLSISKE